MKLCAWSIESKVFVFGWRNGIRRINSNHIHRVLHSSFSIQLHNKLYKIIKFEISIKKNVVNLLTTKKYTFANSTVGEKDSVKKSGANPITSVSFIQKLCSQTIEESPNFSMIFVLGGLFNEKCICGRRSLNLLYISIIFSPVSVDSGKMIRTRLNRNEFFVLHSFACVVHTYLDVLCYCGIGSVYKWILYSAWSGTYSHSLRLYTQPF